MTIRELREKNVAELEKLLREKYEELRGLRFKVSADQHKNVRELRAARKTIARLKTLIHEHSTHEKTS